MKQAFLILTVLVQVSNAYSESSFSGFSRMTIDLPKKEVISVSTNRFVLDSSQQASVSCPFGTKVSKVSCTGTDSLIGEAGPSRTIFTETTVLSENQSSKALCNAVLVHPSKIAKLTVSADCVESAEFSAAKN